MNRATEKGLIFRLLAGRAACDQWIRLSAGKYSAYSISYILIAKLARSKTMLFLFISRAFADWIYDCCTTVRGLATCGSNRVSKVRRIRLGVPCTRCCKVENLTTGLSGAELVEGRVR